MYSLFIDTHSKLLRLVLYKNNVVFQSIEKMTEHNHSSYLLPLIIELLNKVKLNKEDIKQIFVVNGPGSFTGIRIGVCIAKTWAFVRNIKIKSISSLEMLYVSLQNYSLPVAIADSKGFYVGDFQQDKFYYIDKDKIDSNHLALEENIKVDYSKIYKCLEKKEFENPHLVNPVYIKRISVQND